MQNRIFIYDPATGSNDEIMTPSPVGCAVVRKSGGLAAAIAEGFATVDEVTRQVTLIREVDAAGGRFNDGKVDPAGRFFAGTIAKGMAHGLAALHRLDADHSLHRVETGVTISNGIVWTSDRRTMYYTDSPTRRVVAYEYDLATGDIRNRRPVIAIPEALGYPDGMAIDSQDKLWIALWGSGRCCRFDPLNGELLATIEVPEVIQTSSCALGGKNLDELYITTAAEHFTEEQRWVYPLSGSLFRAKVNVAGVPGAEFAG